MQKMENLPDEIIVHILKYVNTFELVQFCETNKRFQHLLRERKLIHQINFSKVFQFSEINIVGLINTRLDPNLIRIFNINGLYWIPTADLIRVISKLNNLEELYALDTKLGLSKNILIYTKLSKLALTLTENNVESNTLTNLKSLCLKIVLTDGSFNFKQLFNEKWQLQELWVSNDRVQNYEIIPYILRDLRKLVIRSRCFSPFYDFSNFGLYMIFQCYRNDSEIQLIYEKVPKVNKTLSMFEPIENNLEESWEILHRHNKDLACGPKESKQLFLKEDIRNIEFEELNFGYSIIHCQLKHIDAASKILLSNNVRKLRKLHFRTCLFQKTKKELQEPQENDLKKARYNMKTDVIDDPFAQASKNMKKLTELEIYYCSGCYDIEFLTSYYSIGAFQNLEKLTLEVPLSMDGSFLKDVLINCQKLLSLKLTITSQNEKFMFKLFESLSHSKSLKDFRLHHVQIHIEKLFDSFNQIENKKLQRIFIICDHLRYNHLETEPFNKFLSTNPQLVFLFLVVRKNTVKQNSNIQKIFNEHKKGNPSKIFYIKKDYTFSGYFPVPTAHHDIIFENTNVSVINLDEF